MSTFQEEVEDVASRLSVFEKVLVRENTILTEINTTDKVSVKCNRAFLRLMGHEG